MQISSGLLSEQMVPTSCYSKMAPATGAECIRHWMHCLKARAAVASAACTYRVDGRLEWNVGEDFDRSMGVRPQQAPGKKRKTVAYLYLRPSQIRFSHHAVGSVFSSGKYSIKDTFLSLHQRNLSPADLPLMYIVQHNGASVSISNRRLAVCRLLEMYGKGDIKVPVEFVHKMGSFSSRYSTKCDGEYAYIRHTNFYIGRTREATNFDLFAHKLSKPPIMCLCCESDADSDAM
ncbi:unnamed protein product [Symbiodinium natans]|uniref:Uncharacterized protein n=1 Tax=Symbiodinium natans TaxID=878477 RepID=A0A812K4Z6_9DINO|nr:unnamed protein product [Symbiodinium natans]